MAPFILLIICYKPTQTQD